MSIESRKIAVAALLVEREPDWVPGYEIASQEVGGSEGLRRIRELRDEGWVIEKQRMKNSTAYEYRIPS
jgi:hypothetical protein